MRSFIIISLILSASTSAYALSDQSEEILVAATTQIGVAEMLAIEIGPIEEEAGRIQELRSVAFEILMEDPENGDAHRLADRTERMWDRMQPALHDFWADRAHREAAEYLQLAADRLDHEGADLVFDELLDVAAAKISFAEGSRDTHQLRALEQQLRDQSRAAR